jgi:opacity protein-like surface antigen
MDMFCFRRFLIIPSLFIFSFIIENQPAFAHTYNDNTYKKTENQWLLGIGGGGAGRNLQSSTMISNGTAVPAPYNHDIYSINTDDHAIIALFGGYQWSSLNKVIPYYSLSLRYEHQFKSNITGTVKQYALPQFKNYNYSMGLRSDIVNIIGKVDLVQYKFFLPYLSAGIGIAFNRINNYAEQAIPPVNPARMSPSYGSKTNSNFAYTLGAGIDITCYRNLWLTLGYEYLNLGKLNSARGAGPWSSTHLHFGTLQTNTALGSLTYLF